MSLKGEVEVTGNEVELMFYLSKSDQTHPSVSDREWEYDAQDENYTRLNNHFIYILPECMLISCIKF